LEKEIINRIANSKLETIDLEDFYPDGNRLFFDISPFLYEGLVLREKDFREQVKTFNWQQFKNCYVALGCSTDAIIPGWAFMLVSLQLFPFSKITIVGSLTDLENTIFSEIINDLDLSSFKDKPVIIKGCSKKSIPQNVYIQLTQKLQPIAKSIMYGEACSSVPLYKKK